ncbi:MAG: 2-iminobutanoate/2-iminopropanoate deaminase [Cellvibrionaceae bacterium]
MSKEIIATENAPAAVGPYSQAVKVGSMVYTSGQIGLNPDGSGMADGLEAQAHQVLKNLSAVLEAAGSSLGNVVKTTVFLSDINDYKVVNGIYAEYFTGAPPARSAVEVANLPLGALVEVEAIGLIG